MFGRGNWAVIGINKDSAAAFQASLADPVKMIAVSQLAASSVTRFLERDAVGINPYYAPRLDEDAEIMPSDEFRLELANYAIRGEDDKKANPLRETDVIACVAYASTEREFQLNASVPVYGLWFVTNEWKDISDVKSLKEAHSYEVFERPYAFVSSTDKKVVDQAVRPVTAAQRKQFPVILDFVSGRLYVENTNKNALLSIQNLLEDLGVETFSVAWDFDKRSNWPSEFLAKLVAESRYKDEFIQAAEDAGRFNKEEREPIEDAELRNILRDYFSMTELESSLWAGLTTPAQIGLHKTTTPIVVQAPVNATTLLGVTNEAFVAAASVTLQERISSVNKKSGEERIFRKDVLTFDVNDQINLTEVGAALLRGFDVPDFKKGILREIKKTKQVPSIQQLWAQWLIVMNDGVRNIVEAVTQALEIKDATTGILPMYKDDENDVIEAE